MESIEAGRPQWRIILDRQINEPTSTADTNPIVLLWGEDFYPNRATSFATLGFLRKQRRAEQREDENQREQLIPPEHR
ncbi:MAG: hypothetical protein C4334_09340 [Pyrinomonas sp.]